MGWVVTSGMVMEKSDLSAGRLDSSPSSSTLPSFASSSAMASSSPSSSS